ncbi:MAG: hypothetical protein V3U24_08955 [Candidatus Neomarinimicrobiota bacterium]
MPGRIHIRRLLERRKSNRPLWWLTALMVLVLFLLRYFRKLAG